MEPTTPSKSSNRNRLSLILQLGSSSNTGSPANSVVGSKPGTPSVGEVVLNSPIESQSPPQATPTEKHKRRGSFILSGTFSSLLRSIPSSPSSAGDLTPQDTVKGRSPNKVRGLSEVLDQMTNPDSLSMDIEEDDVEVAPELAAVKELPDSLPALAPSSVRRKLIRSASASATMAQQRVRSYVAPRPTLPPMPTRKLKALRYERVGSVSHPTKTLRRSGSAGSVSNSHVAADVPVPPLPTELHSGVTQESLTSLVATDAAKSTPTLTDTPRPNSKKHKNRMSLDLSSLTTPLLPSPNNTPPSSSPVSRGVKRSRSLWTPKTESAGGFMAECNNKRAPLSEKQRALNVKRARKMTQLFGHEPPSRLLQFTNLNTTAEDEDEDMLVTPIDENSFSLAPPVRPNNHRHSASMSSFTPSTTSGHHHQAFDSKEPPFSPSSHIPPTISEPRTDPAFTERRRRAAKLAKFFGVGYHDLSKSLLIPLKSSPPTESGPDITSSQNHSPTIEVDVQLSGPTRFWGMIDGRRSEKEADMNDVAARLREMKAK